MKNESICKSRKKIKALAFSVIIVLFSSSLFAQNAREHHGGLFGIENIFEWPQNGMLNRDEEFEDLTNQAFGQEVPLASGLLILFGAAASYAIIKKKED